MGELIEYASNGDRASGYLAIPASGEGPGVVVIQEWWGLVPHITDVAERFATEGFVALAPDLYHGKKTSEPDQAGKEMMALQLPKATKEMSGAVDELLRRSGSDHVGVVGFCMGGGLAIVLAAARPDAVSACVTFYGLIPWPDAAPDYSAISASLLGHYAANDTYFTPEAARGFETELRGLGKDVRIEIYEGTEHAFFNDTRPEVFDAKASAAAWTRTIDLLHSKLG